MTQSTEYSGIIYETHVPRKDEMGSLMYFDESLARLRAAGFERHLRPSELFELLIADDENRLLELGVSITAKKDRLLKRHGELLEDIKKSDGWLSAAFERRGDTLLVYLDPAGLQYDRNQHQYVCQKQQIDCSNSPYRSSSITVPDFEYSEVRQFPVEGAPSQTNWPADCIDQKLVTFLFGHPIKDLPFYFAEDAFICLPPEGYPQPVQKMHSYGLGCWYPTSSSRGIKQKK